MSCLILLIPLTLLWAAVALARRAVRHERAAEKRQARQRHYVNVDGVYGHRWKDFR